MAKKTEADIPAPAPEPVPTPAQPPALIDLVRKSLWTPPAKGSAKTGK